MSPIDRPKADPQRTVGSGVMSLRGRDWAFWVQAFGLLALWAITFTIIGWFGWRALASYQLADSWKPALIVGAGVSLSFVCFSVLLTYVFIAVGRRGGAVVKLPEVDPIEEHLTRGVLSKWSWKFRLLLVSLSLVVAAALAGWWWQLREGLGVTGLGRPVFWALYITNFVFFIGISYGGTLVSAILRVTKGEWRRSITRAAEAVAVLVLALGGWNIFLDLGRPDRAWKLFVWGRMQSPLAWDVVAISTYVIACIIYLYLPLIPDLALMRHRVHGWRRPIYHLFSFGWVGSKEQIAALERAISTMAVAVVPIAVSVHSVVGWVFALTVQPSWHSALFGPYFVLGAMFSGVAALILVLAILRRAMRLEQFIRDVHFAKLGQLLLVLSLLWVYFTVSELLTMAAGGEAAEHAILTAKLTGRFAPMFWVMLTGCFLVPLVVLFRAKTRTIAGTVIASCGVVVGMWIERFTIVVPALENPRLPYAASDYLPSPIELLLMAGCFATFALLYLLFTRLFPVVSLWEVREGREDSAHETAERIRGYFPTAPTPGEETRGAA